MSDVDLQINNFPRSEGESDHSLVVFGPDSQNFAFLIEVDSQTGQLSVTIGNGPENADLPTVVPDILEQVADRVSRLGEDADFWMAVGARQADLRNRELAVPTVVNNYISIPSTS